MGRRTDDAGPEGLIVVVVAVVVGNQAITESEVILEARLTAFLNQQPLDLNADQIAFVFLSRPFFGQLLSPQYQIELSRRLDSVVRLTIVQLASLAAQAEGHREDALEVPGHRVAFEHFRHSRHAIEKAVADLRSLALQRHLEEYRQAQAKQQ